MEKTMYTIYRTNWEGDNDMPSYKIIVEDGDNLLVPAVFGTRQQAFDYAKKCAEKEVESLMEGYEEGDLVSYGIPKDSEYDKGKEIRVELYELEDELDETGVTEIITKYWIDPIIVVK